MSSPASQRTSPAPVTVIAWTVTDGEATRKAKATKSSGATSVSTTIVTGSGESDRTAPESAIVSAGASVEEAPASPLVVVGLVSPDDPQPPRTTMTISIATPGVTRTLETLGLHLSPSRRSLTCHPSS